MTWDVTGAGGTGGGVHATAARMSQYSEAILMGIYGGDKQESVIVSAAKDRLEAE